jgi:hypothetical protein
MSKVTGFQIAHDGTVYLYTRVGTVEVSPKMLAGIAEASSNQLSESSVYTERVPDPPHWYYFQVSPATRGKTITYKSRTPVCKGDIVLLPPLPWMSHDWKSSVIRLGRGDYDGEIREIVSIVY